MKPKLILFDVDGTLIDSYPPYFQIMNQLLPLYGIAPNQQLIKKTFPQTVEQTMKTMNIPASEKDSVLKHYFQFAKKLKVNAVAYPKIPSILQTFLKQTELKLGIVTSRGDNEMKTVFNAIPLAQQFNVIVSADAVEEHKPSPMPIQFAMKQTGVTPSDTIYIGDAITDFQAADRAHAHFAAALWGAHEPDAFSSTTLKLKQPKDLLQLINY